MFLQAKLEDLDGEFYEPEESHQRTWIHLNAGADRWSAIQERRYSV